MIRLKKFLILVSISISIPSIFFVIRQVLGVYPENRILQLFISYIFLAIICGVIAFIPMKNRDKFDDIGDYILFPLSITGACIKTLLIDNNWISMPTFLEITINVIILVLSVKVSNFISTQLRSKFENEKLSEKKHKKD